MWCVRGRFRGGPGSLAGLCGGWMLAGCWGGLSLPSPHPSTSHPPPHLPAPPTPHPELQCVCDETRGYGSSGNVCLCIIPGWVLENAVCVQPCAVIDGCATCDATTPTLCAACDTGAGYAAQPLADQTCACNAASGYAPVDPNDPSLGCGCTLAGFGLDGQGGCLPCTATGCTDCGASNAICVAW